MRLLRLQPERIATITGGIAVLVAGLAVAQPLLGASYLQVHDGFAHLFRLVSLDNAIRQGVLFPRWSPELVFNYGYPIFNFYNPLFSYLAEAFHLAGLPFTDAIRLVVGLLILLAGAGMFMLLRRPFGTAAATIGAVAYLVVPYHLLNVYVRGAFAEMLCYALLPFVALASLRSIDHSRIARGWLAVSGLGVGLLLLAHLPAAAIGIGLLIGLQSTVAAVERSWRRLFALATSLVLGAGLAAFFWLPAIVELPATYIGSFPAGLDDFFRALTTPDQLIDGSIAYAYDDVWNSFLKTGLVQALVALAGLVAAVRLHGRARMISLFAAAATLLLLFLMTSWATTFWRVVPVASLMSFPWRLQAGVGFGTAILAASAVAGVGRLGWVAAPPLAALLAWSAFAAFVPNPLEINDWMVSRVTATRLDADGALTGTTSPAQFVPRWVEGPVQRFTAPEPAPTSLAAQIQSARLLSFDGWSTAIDLRVDQAGPFRLRTFYFPGWWATVNGQPVEVRPDGPEGLLTFDLPAGEAAVRVGFGSTFVRQGAEFASLAALMTFAVLVAWGSRRRLIGIAAVTILAAAGSAVIMARPAAAMTATEASFGNVQLLGWRGDAVDLDRRGAIRLDAIWLVRDQLTTAEPVIEIVDSGGTVMARQQRPPVNGAAPASRWAPGSIVADSYDIALPDGLAAGTYGIRIQWFGAMRDIGTIRIDRAVRIPTDPIRTPVDVTVGGLARLVGADLNGSRADRLLAVRPGDRVQVNLYWQATRPIADDYTTFVHLVDNRRAAIVQADSYPGLDLRFTSAWPTNRPVRDRYDLIVPPDTPAGVYTFVTGLYDRETNESLVAVGAGIPSGDSRIPIGRVLVRRDPPPPSVETRVTWPSVGTLVGFDLPGSPGRSAADCVALLGRCDAIVLHWEAEAPRSRYTVFVHVVDSAGRIVAQHDGEPRDGRWPTDSWSIGDRLLDPHPLDLGKLPAGEYRILVGLYPTAGGPPVQSDRGETVEVGRYPRWSVRIPHRLVLTIMLLIAAGLRFYDLDSAPPGFWYDEGLNGLFARDILAGDLRMFYGDREPLYFYALAGAVWAYGPSIFALRFLTAAAGVLTVAVIYVTGRRLISPTVGLIAASGLAILFWHFAVNRIAERVNLLPLFSLLTIYFLWRALARDGWRNPDALLAGLWLGLTLYTYLASRFFPIALVLFALLLPLVDRRMFQRSRRVWPQVAGVAAVVVLPLGVHYLRFPVDFFVRSSQVGALDPANLLPAFGTALGMFGLFGDGNWRHNIAYRPGFDVVAAASLTAGVARSVVRRRPVTLLLVCWLIVMVAPSALAADNPHFLRAFGALPAAALLAANGSLWWAAQIAASGAGIRLVLAGAAAWFLWSGVSAGQAYFVDWRFRPETRQAFEADVVEGARLIDRLPAGVPVFASAFFRPHPGVTYLLRQPRDIRWFDGLSGIVVDPESTPAYALFGSADREALSAESLLMGLPKQVGASVDVQGTPLFRLYGPGQPSLLPAEGSWPVNATFGETVRVTGVALSAEADSTGLPLAIRGRPLRVLVEASVLRDPGRPDIAFFVQIRDPDGRVIAQEDGVAWPSGSWRPGQRLATIVDLDVPGNAPPGVRSIAVGVYERDGDRLQATIDGRPAGDAPAVASVKIENLPITSTEPAIARFANGVSLIGATFEPTRCDARVCPGTVRLRWRADGSVSENLNVFVHLTGSDGRPLAQADGVPANGLYPTAAWAPGQPIDDIRRLQPPTNLPTEPLRILVGLYRADGSRIPVGSETAYALPVG